MFWSDKIGLSAPLQSSTIAITMANCVFDAFVVIWLYFL